MAVGRPRTRVEPVYPDQVKVTPELARRVWKEGKFAQDPTRYDNRVSPNLSIQPGQFADLSVPERAYGTLSIPTGAYKDTSITNPKLAANAGDSRTQSDNSITSNFSAADGTTTRSHLAADTVGRRELQSHPTNNALRSVGRDHARDGFLAGKHFPTGVGSEIVASANVISLFGGKITGSKSMNGDVLADASVLSSALAGVAGSKVNDASLSEPKYGTGSVSLRALDTAATDNRYALKSHTHSIMFATFPREVRRGALRVRQNIGKDLLITDRVVTLEKLMALVSHILFDEPGITGDEREGLLDSSADFREHYEDHYWRMADRNGIVMPVAKGKHQTLEGLHPAAKALI